MADEKPSDPQDDVLRGENEALKGRLGEYERMLMSPEYLEYLAEKQGGGRPRANGNAAPAPVAQPPKDLDSMSQTQLAQYMVTEIGKRVKDYVDSRVKPVEAKTVSQEAEREVAAVAAKYPDFWDHKQAILKEIAAQPGLAVEKAYKLVKFDVRPAPRTRSGEPPSGGKGLKEKPPEGFEAAFEQAWRAAGLPET